MEPLATWELGLSGNGTRHPLPAVPRSLRPCHALSVPPRGAPILSQPQGDPGTVAGREHPASPTLSSWVPADRVRGRLGTAVAWLPWLVQQDDAPWRFPWQQQHGPRAARCGLQKDPLAFPHWRHPHMSPPAPAAFVCAPAPQGTPWYLRDCHPWGQGPIALLTPPCSPGKRGWVRARGRCKGTPLAPTPKASYPSLCLAVAHLLLH